MRRQIFRMTSALLALSIALSAQSQPSGAPSDGAQPRRTLEAAAQGQPQARQAELSLPASALAATAGAASTSNDAKIELMLRRQEDLTRSIKDLKGSLVKELAPAILSVLGVLFGAALANWSTSRLQKRRLENENKASRATAGIAAASKLMDFKSRQLYELYAPLEALLLQNVTVRGELYRMLIESRCADRMYEMRVDPKGRKGQSLFVVPADGSDALPFRLIEQMAYLQANHGNVMGPVKEIVSVNDRIVSLLHEKIGLVRSENRKLSKRLGRFLAHQGVLQAAVNPTTGVSAPLPYYTTTFPRRLDKLVKGDADILREEIKGWEARTATWVVPLEPSST